MLDMILGLAGAAVGLLLFAAGRYTARLGPNSGQTPGGHFPGNPIPAPGGRAAAPPSASAEGGLAGALQFSPLRRRRDAASR